MVNRSDGVVDRVYIAGKLAWHQDKFSEDFGHTAFGRLMRNEKIEASIRQKQVTTENNTTKPTVAA